MNQKHRHQTLDKRMPKLLEAFLQEGKFTFSVEEGKRSLTIHDVLDWFHQQGLYPIMAQIFKQNVVAASEKLTGAVFYNELKYRANFSNDMREGLRLIGQGFKFAGRHYDSKTGKHSSVYIMKR